MQYRGEGGLPEGVWVLLFVFILSFGGGLGTWSGRKLPLSEWCSVSHPWCLDFISGPWRHSILWGLAGQLATGAAEASRPPSAARSAQTVAQEGPPHVVSWGERIPNAWREHRSWGSRGAASRGAGRGRLSPRKGSFRNGVEGSYLKKNFFFKTQSVHINGEK